MSERGFTLVELVVAMAIMGVVMGGIYAVFVRSNRVYLAQEQIVDAQQEARIALEILGREIRMAGYIAEANGTHGSDPITSGAWGGEPEAAVEMAEVDAAARTTTLAFKSDLDDDGKTEAVRYVYYHSDHAVTDRRNTVTRQAVVWSGGAWINDSGEQLFLANIPALSLSYQLADGTSASSPADLEQIRGVVISLTAQTAQAVEPFEGGRAVRTRRLVSNIQIRNLGLS